MALSPDGTKYFFDWMVAYPERELHGRDKVYSGMGGVDRYTWVSADLPRNVYRLYPTRIEDRFGNYVNYAWSGANLGSISSSDGRAISLAYVLGRVSSVTDGTRTVQYAYTDGLLTNVALPDSSSWSYETADMIGLKRFVALTDSNPWDFPMSCQRMRRLDGGEADLTITHPSGAVGKFRMTFKRLFRTNLSSSTGTCPAVNMDDVHPPLTPADDKPLENTRYDVLAVKQKTISGPGMPLQAWAFSHSDTYSMTPGYPAQGTRAVTTTLPDGSSEVVVFGTDALANEGQLLSSEKGNGTNVLVRAENTYVQTSEMSGMPFPDWMGEPLMYEINRGRSDYNRPMKVSVIKQQGVAFTRTIDLFDVWARPVQVTKSSAPIP